MSLMDILFCIFISGILTWICYCAYSYSYSTTIIYHLDRNFIVGDICYDLSSNLEVIYCGEELCTDNNIYAVVVYTEEDCVYYYHTLPGSLLILAKQE